MKRILLSLAMIAVVGSTAVTATRAYFSSTATVTNNTFATGTLELRVNGQPTVLGAVADVAAPGQERMSPVYGLQNFGPQFFNSGSSNLNAYKLLMRVANPNDSGSGLWQYVNVRVESNRGWSTWEVNYDGLLKDMPELDLFGTRWNELLTGHTQDMRYTVYLPEDNSNQSGLMGKILTWDFVVEARTN